MPIHYEQHIVSLSDRQVLHSLSLPSVSPVFMLTALQNISTFVFLLF